MFDLTEGTDLYLECLAPSDMRNNPKSPIPNIPQSHKTTTLPPTQLSRIPDGMA